MIRKYTEAGVGMTTAVFKDGALQYKKHFRPHTIAIEDIAWAYLQQETINARVCCGRAPFDIGRLIVIDKSGTKSVFQYDGMDEPRKLLDAIQSAGSSVAIGYTQENRDRFEK